MHLTASESAAILKDVKQKDVKGLECKHINYQLSNQYGSNEDMLVIKEVVHLHNGQHVPRLRFVKNYKRPVYVTDKRHRTNKDRKEKELKSKLIRYTCTQSKLTDTVVSAIGYGNPRNPLRQILKDKPWVYGADVTSDVFMKEHYRQKYPDCITPNVVAVFDSETDMRNGESRRPLLISITLKNKAYQVYYKPWVKHIPDYEAKVHKMFQQYLSEQVPGAVYELEMEGFECQGEMAYALLQKAHEWQPDFLVAHNLDFDITVLIEALENAGVNLAQAFSDPRVPPEYRSFRYAQDKSIRFTQDGKAMNKAWYDQWHRVYAPSSFYFACTGSTYRLLRLAAGKEPSYGLDPLLKKTLGINKLYVPHPKVTSKPGGVDWHIDMQLHDPVGYSVYNLFDDILLELMCEKTRDLSSSISMMSGSSSYHSFNSSPKRTADNLYFHLMYNTPYVFGSTSADMDLEHDELVIGRNNWIMTVSPEMATKPGVPLLQEMPGVTSLVYTDTADADIASTYPNGQITMNLSKGTCVYEINDIGDLDWDERVYTGVNLTGGASNAITVLQSVVDAPSTEDLLKDYKDYIAKEIK